MKICVGLSGGVDSSVAALLLKRQGYDVFALFMQNWHDVTGTLHGECEWEEDRTVAEMVARKIGIPFHFVDLSGPYRKRVVDYMFSEYEKGRTPNPDVLCNREIKFDAFLEEAMRLGADMVATGHYCRKEESTVQGTSSGRGCAEESETPEGMGEAAADGGKIYHILEGVDPGKDQSYFLCQLSQEQLSRAMFPIGGLLKSEVRAIAREAGLPSAEKKDSQGICFVGKVDLPVFLQQKIAPREGDIVEVFDSFYQVDSQALFLKECTDGLNAAACESGTLDIGEAETGAPDTGGGGIGALLGSFSDEKLQRFSTPVDYSPLQFETETFRSGRRHVKKLRYKDNPHGKIVGRHDGAGFYTIGQRHGLSVGGHSEPVFVIGTDVEANRVYVGEGQEHPGLLRSCLRIAPDEIHWIRPDLVMRVGESRRYRVRIRYRQPLQDATLLMRSNGLFVVFDRPQRGITPGQFAVWYDSRDEMLGSGVI